MTAKSLTALVVIAFFSIENKKRRSHIFEEMFLLTNISMNIMLWMFFFTLSNIEIDFVGHHIYWRIYTIVKLVLTISQDELIEKKEFVAVVFDSKDEVFVIHIVSIS